MTTRRPKFGSKAMKQQVLIYVVSYYEHIFSRQEQDFEIHCAEFRYFFEELLEVCEKFLPSHLDMGVIQRKEIKLEFLFATSALRPILQKVDEQT